MPVIENGATAGGATRYRRAMSQPLRALIVPALALLATAAAAAEPIAFPEGFRAWAHVSSGVLGPGSSAAPKYEGLHNIYANPAAREGYRTGKFPDGAVIVYDQWTAVHGDGDATTAGARKFVDVMVKDSRRFAATGGWGYTEFTAPANARVEAIEQNAARSCHGCHASQATHDFVFSRWRD